MADNTLIIDIWGDNGSSMEGTETGAFNEMTTLNGMSLTAEQQLKLIDAYGGIDAWGTLHFQPHYSAAWAWAGNTPFQWGKQVASHLGGTRDPMVVRWPGHIKDPGGIRGQYAHVIDVAPTILDAAGIALPKEVNGVQQQPMDGVSFAHTFADPAAKSRHTQQYYEIFGNRGMYKDGWLACARLDRIPWKLDPEVVKRFAPGGGWDPEKDKWELYHLDEDFSQSTDLAAQNPQKLADLKALFFQEAEKYHVTPLMGGMAQFFGFPAPAEPRTKFPYYPGTENIGAGMIPPVYARSYTITADLEVPAAPATAEGVIVAEADVMGGFALYVEDGRLRYTYSMLGVEVTTVSATENLPAGKVAVRYEFKADEPGKMATGGRGRLIVDGKAVGEIHLSHTVPLRFSSYSGMDIGKDNGDPVSPTYAAKSPFPFTGKIGKVVFDLSPEALGAAERQRIDRARLVRAIAN
jgi:arylsulfatase